MHVKEAVHDESAHGRSMPSQASINMATREYVAQIREVVGHREPLSHEELEQFNLITYRVNEGFVCIICRGGRDPEEDVVGLSCSWREVHAYFVVGALRHL